MLNFCAAGPSRSDGFDPSPFADPGVDSDPFAAMVQEDQKNVPLVEPAIGEKKKKMKKVIRKADPFASFNPLTGEAPKDIEEWVTDSEDESGVSPSLASSNTSETQQTQKNGINSFGLSSATTNATHLSGFGASEFQSSQPHAFGVMGHSNSVGLGPKPGFVDGFSDSPFTAPAKANPSDPFGELVEEDSNATISHADMAPVTGPATERPPSPKEHIPVHLREEHARLQAEEIAKKTWLEMVFFSVINSILIELSFFRTEAR